jgi:hypothetical protein
MRSVGVRVEELLEKEAEFERVEEKGEGVCRSEGGGAAREGGGV